MSKSKFTFGRFYGWGSRFAVNKELYTKEQADEMLRRECDIDPERVESFTGYVYFGFVTYEDGRRRDFYWLNDCPIGKNPVECWTYAWD